MVLLSDAGYHEIMKNYATSYELFCSCAASSGQYLRQSLGRISIQVIGVDESFSRSSRYLQWTTGITGFFFQSLIADFVIFSSLAKSAAVMFSDWQIRSTKCSSF